MSRSLFNTTSFLSLFGFAFLFLVIGIFALPRLGVKTQAKRPEDLAASGAESRKKQAMRASALPVADVFLELARKVDQTIPAKRLVAFKAKTDTSSQPRYWGIVDFNQDSTKKRFYVFDTEQGRVEKYYVSHGRGSEGGKDDGVAEVFSNDDGSLSSSLGIYRAQNEYTGQHGRSMRLEGLEPTNSNALSRAIVLHTADYVSEGFIRQTGRLGRSEGCFAVEKAVGDRLIDQLKNSAYIIAWKS